MPSRWFLSPQPRMADSRFAQGYSVAMLVEEPRILEITTFGTLQRHQGELDRNQVLLDVAIIADEADRQLEENCSWLYGGPGRSIAFS
jgi:hypothetical protein